METSDMTHKLWHVSRGIVFQGDSRVVYPRLPLARYHSSPAVVSSGGGEVLPALSATDMHRGSLGRPSIAGDALRAASAGKTTTMEAQPAAAPATAPALEASAGSPSDSPTDLEPPFTPLKYKISPEAFREAKQAAEGSPESFWSYSLYRGPSEDGKSEGPKPKVHYCKSMHTTERVIQRYFMDEKLLGFDLEWAPDATRLQGARRNVCVVQLASESRIAIFHLALYPRNDSLLAPSLKKIMEDPTITKAGVWIKGDCTRLRKFLGVEARGIFELSNLHRLVKYSMSGEHKLINRKLVSLATQVQEWLHLPLFKGSDVRSSDWSQELQMNQILYSASDAYVAVHLYALLDHHRKNLDPVPPLPHHAELGLPIELAHGGLLPNADEAQDQEQGAAAEDAATAGPNEPVLTSKYLKSINDTINIEQENDLQEPIVIDTTITTTTTAKEPKQAPRPKDPRIAKAELWANSYRFTNPKARSPAYILRAYYLWYKNEDLAPEQVAALLREPPLQTSTVIQYLFEGIRLDKLPYSSRRMRIEVLERMSKEQMTTARYKVFLRACLDAERDDEGGGEGAVTSISATG
ncbi:exonuclease-like protein [Podospora appendiculata]|uniref:Exonuclease-like protein n=1 Tax=Podospora appendiculata TaxID=314037 RepID=A0AAE0X5P7_9PEZI|nr:exonuclease-like protein [Podospora appendiculata]